MEKIFSDPSGVEVAILKDQQVVAAQSNFRGQQRWQWMASQQRFAIEKLSTPGWWIRWDSPGLSGAPSNWRVCARRSWPGGFFSICRRMGGGKTPELTTVVINDRRLPPGSGIYSASSYDKLIIEWLSPALEVRYEHARLPPKPRLYEVVAIDEEWLRIRYFGDPPESRFYRSVGVFESAYQVWERLKGAEQAIYEVTVPRVTPFLSFGLPEGVSFHYAVASKKKPFFNCGMCLRLNPRFKRCFGVSVSFSFESNILRI